MDFGKLEQKLDDGVEMQIVHPEAGEAIEGAFLTLLSQESKQVRSAQARSWDKRRAMGGRRSALPTAAEAQNDSLETIVAATVGWRGIELDGKSLDYSAENARTLYRRFPWLRKQAEDFIAADANFLKS